MTQTIDEAKISSANVFFHGSSEERMTKVDRPSYEHPFYVTTDIHYAMAFCTKTGSNTGEWHNGKHKKFTPSDDNFVYAVSLKTDAEFYDFRKDSVNESFLILKEIIPENVIAFVRERMKSNSDNIDMQDIYAFIAQMLSDVIFPFCRFRGIYQKYIDDNDMHSPQKLTPMSYDAFFDAAQMIHDLGAKVTCQYDVHQFMAYILKALHKQGFSGIITAEKDFNDEHIGTQISTDCAIGIFDVKALDVIGLVPMRYRWLKKITKFDQKADLSAVQKIRRYIQLYKSIEKQ